MDFTIVACALHVITIVIIEMNFTIVACSLHVITIVIIIMIDAFMHVVYMLDMSLMKMI